MTETILKGYSPLLSFFEKQVEWLGLSKNTGLVLATLYVVKYESGRRLNIDEISNYTSYSRSNLGLIISQLEALGLIYGEADFGQTGRGRRRALYAISEDASSLIGLGVKKMIDRLEELLENINSLIELYDNDAPHIIKMLREFKKDAKENTVKLSNIE